MPLTLHQIKFFLTVARNQHFSSAAQQLQVAQPAVSRTIRALEKELGVTLFKRSSRSVELTQEGRLFQSEIEQAANQIDHAVMMVQEAAKGHAGYLRIGYTDFAIEGRIPIILKEFRSRYQHVKLEVRASYTDKMLLDLRENRIDIGFVMGPIESPELSTLLVQNDRFVLVVSDSHPLAETIELRLADLDGEPLILGDREIWAPYLRKVEAICSDAGFVPNVVQEADTIESIFAFVASGMGSSIYVERAFNYNPPGICIRHFQGLDSSISSEMVWRSDNQSLVVRNFVELSTELVSG